MNILIRCKGLLSLILLILACVSFPTSAASSDNPFDTWQPVTTLPSGGAAITSMFYIDGKFVLMVNTGGYTGSTSYVSSDLATWKAGSGLTTLIQDMAYGNGTYVAVGWTTPGPYCPMSKGKIYTSLDGLKWTNTVQSPPGSSSGDSGCTTYGFQSVKYKDNLFMVQQSYTGLTWTSADGITWQTGTIDVRWDKMAYGNGLYVSVGGDSAATSSDGINWTSRTVGTGLRLTSVAFGNNIFLAAGGSGTVYASSDGVTWVAKKIPGPAYELRGVVYANERFYIAGDGGTFLYSGPIYNYSLEVVKAGKGSGRVETTPAGIDCGSTCFQHYEGVTNVTLKAIPDAESSFAGWSGACTGNSPTCPVTVESIRYVIAHFNSVDPLNTWKTREIPITGTISGIAAGNGTLAIIGQDGDIATSADGVVWVKRSVEAQWGLWCITFGNGIFAAIDGGGGKVTSSDGVTWTVTRPEDEQWLNAVVFGNNGFVAVGGSGDWTEGGISTVVTSTDGKTWTKALFDLFQYKIGGIAYGNSSFVAISNDGGFDPYSQFGLILTSPDGITWTSKSLQAESSTMITLSGIGYGNNLFVAVGYNTSKKTGLIFTSPDGVNWTERASGVNAYLSAVTYGNSTYVITGTGGAILTSTDGITWKSRTSGNTNALKSVTYANGTFVAVGESGTVLQSNPVTGFLKLSPGWNLISLPLQPTDTATATVLSDINGKYSIVWGDFNPTTQQWKYKNSSGGGLLNTITAGKAYWVYVTDAVDAKLNNIGDQVAHNITLKPGWNFVGFNKTANQTTSSALTGIAGNYSIVWGDFNPSTQQWKYKSSSGGGLLNNIETGKGYWIYNNTSSDINWSI